MIKVVIGDSERDYSDVDMTWINEQIERRRRDGRQVCVRVFVKDQNVDLVLSTSCCPSQGGGTRKANPEEMQIFNLWEKLNLKDNDFSGGNLMAFLRQLAR